MYHTYYWNIKAQSYRNAVQLFTINGITVSNITAKRRRRKKKLKKLFQWFCPKYGKRNLLFEKIKKEQKKIVNEGKM